MSYSKTLKATPYAISEQLSVSVCERCTAQIPLMAKIRKEAHKKQLQSQYQACEGQMFYDQSADQI